MLFNSNQYIILSISPLFAASTLNMFIFLKFYFFKKIKKVKFFFKTVKFLTLIFDLLVYTERLFLD